MTTPVENIPDVLNMELKPKYEGYLEHEEAQV